ncbi:ABC-three component system protein [Photobacterium phosphoreum]|uniref:ABC-three component system protein n=1 Tax=Photobacterium phosphoreum TaxID=659 RepID=UPI0039B0A726
MKNFAVVFIHGLKGGESTWVNDNGISFKDLLEADNDIKDNCEIIEYDYFTQITEFMNGFVAKQMHNFIRSLPIIKNFSRFKKAKKNQRNKSIEDLSKGLASTLRAKYSNFDHVILIGHSMGGLVAKRLIIDQIEKTKTIDISGYISIAVPHKGSMKSLFLQFSSNEHIKELQPLDRQTLELDEKWEKYKDKLPKASYLVALDDEVVKPHTAKPNNIKDNELWELDKEDHTSICKPIDEDENSYRIVREFIKEIISDKKKQNDQLDVMFQDLSELDQEVFVIKLLISDVEETLIDSSKSSFFNAEIFCRVNKSEFSELRKLYAQVQLIYSQNFYKYKNECKTSSELVHDIHQEIIDKDQSSLASSIKDITFLEKIGMLHQLADRLNNRVVWQHDFDINKVKEHLNAES